MLVAHQFSRRGGAEEVSRQVRDVLTKASKKLICLETGNTLSSRVIAVLLTNAVALAGVTIVAMHPHIVRRFIFQTILNLPWVKVIVWAHGIEVWGAHGSHFCSKLKSVTKIIAVSNYTKNHLSKNFPGVPIEVVWNAIDTTLYSPSKKSFKRSVFSIITVGRMSVYEQYKGHDLVLEALAALKAKNITVRYDIVGTGDDLQRLKTKAASLGLAQSTYFHGFVDDEQLAKLYLEADLFVMPSAVQCADPLGEWGGEGFGLVYVEAAFFGLASVACNFGGQTDIILHGKTGSLVAPKNAEVAKELEFYQKNRGVCRLMGKRAQQRTKRLYTNCAFSKRVLRAVYDSE